MANFQEDADEIVKRIDEKFGIKRDNNIAFIQLFEEIGELVRQPNKANMRNEKMDLENLEEELADVLILLSNIAAINNINLEEAVAKKIEILKGRHDL